ncbi:MAG: PDZ domain-containing protein [Nitrospira sp.]|nr:PDZ domain-containing protein [Nitrospira sp.]
MWNGTTVGAAMVFGLLLSGSLYAADQPGQVGQVPAAGVAGGKGPDGVIGVSLRIGAERVGDPASLYIGRVHREGPAYKAGLRHGDELLSVDGTAVSGKSYEQLVKMVRGEAGSTVKLQIKREGEGSPREISVMRVASDSLARRPAEHGLHKDKP